MSDSTFLTRVVIENYKSIAACDVRLGSLTFLVGPNAAGKSNFLDALHFVRDGLVDSLDKAVRVRGGSRCLIHFPVWPSAHLRIRLEFNLPSGLQGCYGVSIGHSPINGKTWRWEVVEEECHVGSATSEGEAAFFRVQNGHVASSVGTVPEAARDRLYLVRASGISPFRGVYEALCDMHFYHVEPRSIHDIDTYDPQQRLSADGSNLASVLAVLQHADPSSRDRVEEFLRLILPGLTHVSAEPVIVEHRAEEGEESSEPGTGSLDGERIALVFQQKIGRAVAPFRPTQMSEGTLRTLAILAALYQIDFLDRRPTLTVIEDVEAAIYPATMGVLLGALHEASHWTQVLVTSHSPDLLDDKDIPEDSILAVAAEGGMTRIGPLGEADRSVLRDRLFTAGELLRAGQLTPAAAAAGGTGAEQPRLFDGGKP